MSTSIADCYPLKCKLMSRLTVSCPYKAVNMTERIVLVAVQTGLLSCHNK